jgi:hypothetical protein
MKWKRKVMRWICGIIFLVRLTGFAEEPIAREVVRVNRWELTEFKLPEGVFLTDWRSVPQLHSDLELTFPLDAHPAMRSEAYAVVPDSRVNCERPEKVFLRKRERSDLQVQTFRRAGNVFLRA